MTLRVACTVVLSGAVTFGACADQQDDAFGTDGSRATATDPAPAPSLDQQFINNMITAGMKEVELAQMALDKAAHIQVKELARMMIRDHRAANQQLAQTVSQLGRTVAQQLEELQDARKQLVNLSGAAFDRAYITMMVNDHQRIISMAESKADGGGNDQIQQWASNVLPGFHTHLQLAQLIQSELR
jgi:putative membrane protein